MNESMRKMRSKDWAVRLWNGWRIFWNIFNKKGVLSHASVCGYATILSLVPIVAISLTILSAFTSGENGVAVAENQEIIEQGQSAGANGDMNSANAGNGPSKDFSDQVFDFFFRFFIPVYAQGTSEELIKAKNEVRDFLNKIAGLRFVSITFLVFASVGLFNSIEHAFNEIWSVRYRRSLYSRFLAFWLLLTLTPLLLGLSYYFTSQFISTLLQNSMSSSVWYQWLLSHSASFLLTLAAFLFANRYLPNSKVHLMPALYGSILSAVMWESAKGAFDLYMQYASTRGFYGLFGTYVAIPIFILWLYYSYICFLIGPVIATTIQDYSRHLSRLVLKTTGRTYMPLHTLKLFLSICHYFYWEKHGVSFEQLEEQTGWDPLWIRSGLRDLRNCNLVHQDRKKGWFYPNADPDQMTLGETAIRLFGFNLEQKEKQPADQWEQMILDSIQNQPNLTIQTLIEQHD